MNLGILFSGGKDSSYALYKASEENEIKVLITLDSENKDSYMFHTPVEKAEEQASKLEIPLLKIRTEGKKEEELEDLKIAIKKAIDEYEIEGVVTGAVASTYQASRVQRICDDLDIYCFNPLWQKDQVELLREITSKIKVKIVKVAAEGLDESWVGKIIDNNVVKELIKLKEKYGINVAGEGGEYETEVEEFYDCSST
ncbi:MAG: TIGR00289 family protein [Nanoarchaeota archaeon]|nr:TIGR00289 family protein [Nanoarchaeota archaeon]|tara:strand:+ start:1974 stop:2567 length:594 start_codon:yes stop_codon:yes gene_type:complete